MNFNYSQTEGNQYEGPVEISFTSSYKSCCSCKWFSRTAAINDILCDVSNCNHPISVAKHDFVSFQEDKTPHWCPLIREE